MKSGNGSRTLLIDAAFHSAGIITALLLVSMVAVILIQSIPFLFSPAGLSLFDLNWNPDSGDFGILSLIFGSVYISLIAMFFAVPLSIGTAIIISEYTGPSSRRILKMLLQLFSGIPGVVYGFIGIFLLGPWLRSVFDLEYSLNALTAGLLLAMMAIPTITEITEEAIRAVPQPLREASYSLGLSRFITSVKVILPAAMRGIAVAVLLGLARVVGETMTMLMVSGQAAQISLNPAAPMRTLTGTIGSELISAQTGSPHFQAIFTLALVLLLISLAVNSLAGLILNRMKQKGNLL